MIKKEFFISHAFTKVSEMNEGAYSASPQVEHFNIPWCIRIYNVEKGPGVYLHCLKTVDDSKWAIETEYQLKVFSSNGRNKIKKFKFTFNKKIGRGCPTFLNWETLKNEYLVDDTIIVEAQVQIIKTTGIKKEKLRNFGEEMSDLSDVVLIIEDEKFYTSKWLLANLSTYFKDLLQSDQYKNLEKPEIKLDGINFYDFQNFMELINGEDSIDDETITGIIEIASKFIVPSAIKRCEDWIIKESNKTMKQKLKLSSKFDLKNLKNYCLRNINTKKEIREVLPGDVTEIDPSLAIALLHKSILLE